MPKWEYMTWSISAARGDFSMRIHTKNGKQLDDFPHLESELSTAGERGWELVGTMSTNAFNGTLFFKRLLPDG